MENIIPRPPSDVFETTGNGAIHITKNESNFLFPMVKCVLGGKEYAYFNFKDLPANIQEAMREAGQEYTGLRLMEIRTKDHASVPQEGQFVYLDGLLHPRKGFVFPEVLYAVNIFKRVLISAIQALASKELALSILSFGILPWFMKKKVLDNWLTRIDEIAFTILDAYRLKENCRMLPAKELDKWITNFINNLGLGQTFDGTPRKLGFGIGMIIEYDSAYTLRFQDIMTEASKEAMLANPAKELGRLVSIFATREARAHLNKKIQTVVRALKLLFWIPRVRKAFIKATAQVNFSNLALTEADRYECLPLDGYQFLGRSVDDRIEELAKMHGGKIPVPTEVRGKLV